MQMFTKLICNLSRKKKCSLNDCFMQLLSVSLKSRPHEQELVGFEKLSTKTLKCINQSVFSATFCFI